jgi:glycosyltransferase involved in cell wall biosynthesis
MSVPLRVAFDVGPLHGHRTGVGQAVGSMRGALETVGGVELLPYVVSARARLRNGERRMPIPAALAQRMWARRGSPRLDFRFHDADLVHGTNYVVPPSRLPRVVSVYDCWFLAHPDRVPPVVARAGEVLRRAAAGGAYIHTSSQASAVVARRLLDTDRVVAIHLAPLPITPPPAEPPIAGLPTGPYIVAIGTQEQRKNLPRLVDAFAIAAADGLDAGLVIAGAEGDDTAATIAGIEALVPAVRKRVVHLGQIGDSTKWWLLHHAAALAYPSLDEGFGFPVLEAQSIGLPVVGGAAGSIPEVGGEGIELVDPLDPASIAGGLLRAVDERRRTDLIAGGRDNLARFSWSRTAAALRDLYHRAVEDST